MLRLLEDVASELEQRSVPFALVGAAAMAAHGVSRSTADLDLLVLDPAVLAPAFWARLQAGGTAADVRRGEGDDPLAGVVRLSVAGERPVDLVVGRADWQRAILQRARPIAVGRARVPVATGPLPREAVLLWERIVSPGG